MSILIKGMKLPENDGMKELVIGRAPNGTEPIAIVSGDITGFYKIIEIPTPHGRLIDCESKSFPIAFGHESTDYAKGWNACLRSVLLSPTIIEAEVSDNA